MVPEVGIEPTLSQGKGDFESPERTKIKFIIVIILFMLWSSGKK
jgi:hypothetical protein